MNYISRRLRLLLSTGLFISISCASPSHGQTTSHNMTTWGNHADYNVSSANAPDNSYKELPLPNIDFGDDVSLPLMTPSTTKAVIETLENHTNSKNLIRPDNQSASITPPNSQSLKALYERRTEEALSHFGYDIFNYDVATNISKPSGKVQDDFILHHGDELYVHYRGLKRGKNIVPVQNDGNIYLEDLPPIMAAGLSIAQVQNLLSQHVQTQFNTKATLTLHGIKQINVLVIGNVAVPGRKNLTSFHSIVDALTIAGGIRETGSLRSIKIIRDGQTRIIDLYDILLDDVPQGSQDFSLRDGDRIIVPPIGATVAVTGAVKRPGIYEMSAVDSLLINKSGMASQSLTIDDLLRFSGGPISQGQNRFMHLYLTRDGFEKMEDVSFQSRPVFNDQSILSVANASEKKIGYIEVKGHSRIIGPHPFKNGMTLAQILGNESAYKRDIYPLFAYIERWDDKSLATKFIDFAPLSLENPDADLDLLDGDKIHLFSKSDIRNILDDKGSDKFDDALTSHMKERVVFLRGAVRESGSWPVSRYVTIQNLIAAAGGLTIEASAENVELTSKWQIKNYENPENHSSLRMNVNLTDAASEEIYIGPGDFVRIKQKFKATAEQSVMIMGEVLNPGSYDLMPGDKISDLIQRAGGLSPHSYPQGAIFSRASERRAEEKRFRAQAQDLEMKLASLLKSEESPNTQEVAMVNDLIVQLKQAEAIGRITVEADPSVLQVDPELDILLEKGDRVFIPKRPLTVRVAGEVLSPANLQFRKDRNPRDYIQQAGGYSWFADKDRVFVVYPDGSAQPLSVSSWNHNPVFIPPGSTIIIPRDPKPFDFLETARDITQIISNLTITGLFIHDIRAD
jgi:polysaccharide export outer membrane protein